ncbi:hypothetical protein RJ55_03980 [Drechmeria coniospora]|nr:hypothetical protein RJ55_03980 [Drechmeria coniospora]
MASPFARLPIGIRARPRKLPSETSTGKQAGDGRHAGRARTSVDEANKGEASSADMIACRRHWSWQGETPTPPPSPGWSSPSRPDADGRVVTTIQDADDWGATAERRDRIGSPKQESFALLPSTPGLAIPSAVGGVG